ncbi:uncharacterized protein [Drosophila kikkawai]|uniref:Uncharacterized protein isoform X1 n=1 Tax=Drosophila kikkawai TaxID=30033 RepID=A0ABM4GQC1_DROKI
MTRLQWVQMPREEALHHPDWPVGRGPLCANSVAKQEAPHHEELPAVKWQQEDRHSCLSTIWPRVRGVLSGGQMWAHTGQSQDMSDKKVPARRRQDSLQRASRVSRWVTCRSLEGSFPALR